MIITADHGNAEIMKNEQGEPFTEHTGNPVPFVVVSEKLRLKSVSIPSGILGDIAPTILKLMNLPAPTSMMGRDLLEQFNRRY